MAAKGFEVTIDTGDMKALEAAITALGAVPSKCVNSAAAKAGTLVKRAVRQGTVPVDTGALKSGIIRKAEKSRVRGKKVYQVTMDRGMNDIFQKPIKNPGEAGGTSKHAYYPSSQEFGYLTRSKGGGLSYVPGYHFMRDGGDSVSAQANALMIETLTKNLEKEWRKKNA